ncbi:unnamed protein product [Boreogadus saida]
MVTFTTQGANMTDTMPGPNDGEPHALLFLLRKEHGLAHEGKAKTLERIERYWWHPDLKAVCDQYVQDCQMCQACNQRRESR